MYMLSVHMTKQIFNTLAMTRVMQAHIVKLFIAAQIKATLFDM